MQTGTSFQISAAALPASEVIGDGTYNFSFVNISGLVEGSQTSFDNTVAPPAGTVGTNAITVLVVYLPSGGGGNGKYSGAVIDAFDETTGSLVDDTFVNVSTNGAPDATQTTSGNVYGYVDTTDNTETITAIAHILPTNANFDKWVNLGSPASLPAGVNLTVDGGTSIYALAFYKNPARKIIHKEAIKEIKEYLKDIKESIYDKQPILEVGPQKQQGKDKDGKEIFENPGDQGYGGDPVFVTGELIRINQAVANLAAKLDGFIAGAAFIKENDRPVVGRSIAQSEEETD